MDTERLAFLFGDGIAADEWDLDNEDNRSLLLERSFGGELEGLQLLLREVVANQIFADDPAEVWATARRLLARGLDRGDVFRQLVLALGPALRGALEREQPFDPEAYAAALGRLPLPSAGDIEDAIVEVVRAEQGIRVDELEDRALERLGREPDEEVVDDLMGHVIDHLVDDLGPLAWVADDRTVHVQDLTSRIVLTHRLTEGERATSVIDAAFDLAGFTRRDELTLPDGRPVRPFSEERGHLGWLGPAGWLDAFPAGVLLTARVDAAGVVKLRELDEEVITDPELVARVRAAYDAAVAEPWLPVDAESLVLAVLLENRATFQEPRAPLSDLCAAAGLDCRGGQVAHDDTVWHSLLRTQRIGRVLDEVNGDDARSDKALRALDVADLVTGVDPAAVPEIEGEVDAGMLGAVLDDLADEEVLSAFALDLFDRPAPDVLGRAAFIDVLVDAAVRPRQVAIARWLAAVHAERTLEPLAAERHLALAHDVDPESSVVIDRLAWYASDRGDARRAAQLWKRLGSSSGVVDQDLREVAPFASAHAILGRNQPCWCGSGRKYKQCHLGTAEMPPLPDRVGWMCRKAAGYLARRGGAARADVLEIAYARADDPDDRASVAAALDDPIVVDLALTEAGWFEQFLEERGALLPSDEEMLARAWLLVDRSVYEITDIDPGHGMTLRDLRSGDRLDVRERTFSREGRVGALICGRAVPDGHTSQLVGGLFPVAPGTEAGVLDLLEEGDPLEIAGYVGLLARPPVLQTREGEPLVRCETVVEVGDPDAARAFLDATYEIDDSHDAAAWTELHPLAEDEEIVRATLELDGRRLSVSTMSEARADRLVSALRGALGRVRVISDVRTPVDAESLMRRQALEPVPPNPDRGMGRDDPAAAAAVAQLRDQLEGRWCDESVPALGGLTPRAAAADPTRRPELERLIASFESYAAPAHAVTMRPHRLRELLDLEPPRTIR